MKETYGEMEIDEAQLKAADPDGLYLFMLEQYPYMTTPDNVAAFAGTTGQEIRKLLGRGEMQGCRIGIRWLVPKLGLLNYLYKDRRKKEGDAYEEAAQQHGDSSVCWFCEPAHRTVPVLPPCCLPPQVVMIP